MLMVLPIFRDIKNIFDAKITVEDILSLNRNAIKEDSPKSLLLFYDINNKLTVVIKKLKY